MNTQCVSSLDDYWSFFLAFENGKSLLFFSIQYSEWKCSFGTLWTSSVDPRGGDSGTPAMQYPSCIKGRTTEDTCSIWKISWNCCFSLAVVGIHSGSIMSSLIYIITVWKWDLVILYKQVHPIETYSIPRTSQIESYDFGTKHSVRN